MGGGMSGRTLSRRGWSQHASGRCHQLEQSGHFGRCSITDFAGRNLSRTDSAALQACAEVAFSPTRDSNRAPRCSAIVRANFKQSNTKKSGAGGQIEQADELCEEASEIAGYMQAW